MIFTGEGNRIFRYSLTDQPNAISRTLVYTLNQGDVTDGIRMDQNENLYISVIATGGGAHRVVVVSSEGSLIREILLPSSKTGPTNLTFGGVDGKTVYVTSRGNFGVNNGQILSFRTEAPGMDWIKFFSGK